jgi:hypothetical protein
VVFAIGTRPTAMAAGVMSGSALVDLLAARWAAVSVRLSVSQHTLQQAAECPQSYLSSSHRA